MKVDTSKGQIDRTKLIAKDTAVENDDHRVMATEWYLDGEMVRRDVWVNPLRHLSVGVKHGS